MHAQGVQRAGQRDDDLCSGLFTHDDDLVSFFAAVGAFLLSHQKDTGKYVHTPTQSS